MIGMYYVEFFKISKQKSMERILPDPNVGLNGVRLVPNSTVSDEETPEIIIKISKKTNRSKIFLLSSVDDFWAFKRFCVGEGDGGGGWVWVLSFGLGIVGDENEFCTCISVPKVLDTCCCNEFDAFLCIPNIVNANCVPIGGVGGVGDVVEILFDACCLVFCKSRFDVIIDFIKRVEALPFKSLLFSIKLNNNNNNK